MSKAFVRGFGSKSRKTSIQSSFSCLTRSLVILVCSSSRTLQSFFLFEYRFLKTYRDVCRLRVLLFGLIGDLSIAIEDVVRSKINHLIWLEMDGATNLYIRPNVTPLYILQFNYRLYQLWCEVLVDNVHVIVLSPY